MAVLAITRSKNIKSVLRAHQVPSVIGLKGVYRTKLLFVFHRVGHRPQLAQSTQDILDRDAKGALPRGRDSLVCWWNGPDDLTESVQLHR